jgi:peptidoglycan/xylan/chitin deacetylase (PgdA/CDA1 family)
MMLKTLSPLLLSALALAAPTQEKRQAAAIITSCTVPGTFALTFDDGPYAYTSQLLDILAANGVKATFFLNGQNYDNIANYASVVQRMVTDSHQIGSHT